MLRKFRATASKNGLLREYLRSVLYSVALGAGLEDPTLGLLDRAGDAAYDVVDRWTGHLTEDGRRHGSRGQRTQAAAVAVEEDGEVETDAEWRLF